jgi:hypothetical protein
MAEDRELVVQMVPFLERGAEALRVHCASMPAVDRLTATDSLLVVTQEDYVAQPLLCLRYATHVGPLHILLRVNGSLFALLARLTRTR